MSAFGVNNSKVMVSFWRSDPWVQKHSTATVADGEWHLIGYTYDGGAASGTIKIYVDGVEDSSHSLALHDVGLTINQVGAKVQDFDGQIRDFKIFPSALTASDIRKLYSGENPKKNLNVNLTTNGDFTANNSSWTGQSLWSNTAGADGTAGNLLITTETGGSWGYIYHAETILTVGKYYKLSFWFKKGALGTEGGTFRAGTSSLGGEYANWTYTLGTSQQWTKFEKVFKATHATIHLNPASSTGAAPNSAHFDDIRVEEVGTLVDFNSRSASSETWYNQAIPAFYNGSLEGGVTLSAGSTDYEVGAGEDRSFKLGKLTVGPQEAGHWCLGHTDFTGSTQFALKQRTNGEVGLNTIAGKSLYLSVANATALEIDSNKNVKIPNGGLGVGMGVATGELISIKGDAKYFGAYASDGSHSVILGTDSSGDGRFVLNDHDGGNKIYFTPSLVL